MTIGSRIVAIIGYWSFLSSTRLPIPGYYVAVIPSPPPTNALAVEMSGINNSGQVVGLCQCRTGYQAYIYTTSGYTALPLPAGWTSAMGFAINDSGQITGYGFNGAVTTAEQMLSSPLHQE